MPVPTTSRSGEYENLKLIIFYQSGGFFVDFTPVPSTQCSPFSPPSHPRFRRFGGTTMRGDGNRPNSLKVIHLSNLHLSERNINVTDRTGGLNLTRFRRK